MSDRLTARVCFVSLSLCCSRTPALQLMANPLYRRRCCRLQLVHPISSKYLSVPIWSLMVKKNNLHVLLTIKLKGLIYLDLSGLNLNVLQQLTIAVWWKPSEDTSRVLDQNGGKRYTKQGFGKLTWSLEVYRWESRDYTRAVKAEKGSTREQLFNRRTLPQKHWLEDTKRLRNKSYIRPFKTNGNFVLKNWKTSEQENPTAVFPEYEINQMLPFHICTAGSPQLIQKGWHSVPTSSHFPVNRKLLSLLKTVDSSKACRKCVLC